MSVAPEFPPRCLPSIGALILGLWSFPIFQAQSLAADPDPAATSGSPLPSDPVFSALRVDGNIVLGRLKQIGSKGEISIVPLKGAEETIRFGEIVKLTREGFFPNTSPTGSLVLFPNGDRLYRTVIGAAGETSIEVQSYALEHLSIPLDSILGLVLNLPDDNSLVSSLIDRVRFEPRNSEVLLLRNGDKMTGGFLGLEEKKIKFQASAGPISLERAGILALGFDPSLVVYPEANEDGAFDLSLADGSRLGVKGVRIEQGQITATTRFGAKIRVPLNEVIRIHARSTAISYLSERAETAVRYVGYVGPTRPYRRDESVDGQPLKLGGQVYDRGLGTQSRTILAYRMSPGDRRFQAMVGLDDAAGPLGSVVFRVLVDGREVFATPAMSVRDTPRPIDVEIAGGKLLILVTEFGERGEVRDFADWIEARILR